MSLYREEESHNKNQRELSLLTATAPFSFGNGLSFMQTVDMQHRGFSDSKTLGFLKLNIPLVPEEQIKYATE